MPAATWAGVRRWSSGQALGPLWNTGLPWWGLSLPSSLGLPWVGLEASPHSLVTSPRLLHTTALCRPVGAGCPSVEGLGETSDALWKWVHV